MSVKSYWYTNYFKQLLQASPAYGGWKVAAGDTFKLMLMTPSYTPNQDTHAVKSQVSGEVVGSGYIAGGQTLASKTISTTSSGNLILGGADITWGACTFTTDKAVIYDDTNALATAKQLVMWIDFGQLIELNNQALTLKFDNLGQVDVIVLPPPDLTPPQLTGTIIVANPIVLTYDELLDATHVPAPGDFAVLVNSVARVVNTVAIIGANLSLTLASDVAAGDTVTVSYTAPVIDHIQDLAGNDLPSFTNQPILNSTSPPADTTDPVLQTVICDGNQITLAFDEPLDPTSTPANANFTITVAGAPDAVTSVTILGTTVVLLLTTSASQGQAVTLAYAVGVNPIRDTSLNAIANIPTMAVTNNSPDIIPPSLSSAVISNPIMTLVFSKELASFIPAGTAFTVTVNGANQAAPLVALSADTILLSVAAPVIDTDVVVIAYTAPAVNYLRDLSGNAVHSFLNFPVQNFTPPAPPLVDGATFVSQSVPDVTMNTQADQSVSITMQNSGTTSWAPSSYQLYSQNPAGNTNWGRSTVTLTSSTPPGSNVTFNFGITAPAIAGTYNFQWRMQAIGGAVFGATTPNVSIVVASPIASTAFQLGSTWTTPVPASPSLNANSANVITRVASIAPLSYSNSVWSVPIWRATGTEPLRNWTYTTGSTLGRNAILNGGWHLNIPTNPLWHAASQSDGHMVIVSADGNTAWDFYRANVSTVTCYNVKRWDLRGTGIDQPYTYAGCRLAPVPLLHGLIRYEEMQAGVINHALAFAVGAGAKSGTPGVYPCVTSNSGTGTNANDPWLGYRFQLNPALNLAGLGLSSGAMIVAVALQTYGMILVEQSGGTNVFYAEDLQWDSSRSWGTTFSTVGNIPISQMRIIQPLVP